MEWVVIWFIQIASNGQPVAQTGAQMVASAVAGTAQVAVEVKKANEEVK